MVRNAQTWDGLVWNKVSKLYEFARAVLTEDHTLMVLKQRKLSFCGSGGWKSETRCRQGWGPLSPPPGLGDGHLLPVSSV